MSETSVCCHTTNDFYSRTQHSRLQHPAVRNVIRNKMKEIIELFHFLSNHIVVMQNKEAIQKFISLGVAVKQIFSPP